MREVLEPLCVVPGVRQVAVIGDDGVPACVLERDGKGGGFVDRTTSEGLRLAGQRIDPESFAALAAGWLDELARAGGQLSWDAPRRATLVASQGSLVVQRGPGTLVLIVLDPGTPTDSLSVPLEGSIVRLERKLRQLGGRAEEPAPPSPALPAEEPVEAEAHPMLRPDATQPSHGGPQPSDPSGER